MLGVRASSISRFAGFAPLRFICLAPLPQPGRSPLPQPYLLHGPPSLAARMTFFYARRHAHHARRTQTCFIWFLGPAIPNTTAWQTSAQSRTNGVRSHDEAQPHEHDDEHGATDEQPVFPPRDAGDRATAGVGHGRLPRRSLCWTIIALALLLQADIHPPPRATVGSSMVAHRLPELPLASQTGCARLGRHRCRSVHR